MIYLKEHHISSYDELEEKLRSALASRNALKDRIRTAQSQMTEIRNQRNAILSYRKTKDIYTQYRESGWSPAFYREHKAEIEAHKRHRPSTVPLMESCRHWPSFQRNLTDCLIRNAKTAKFSLNITRNFAIFVISKPTSIPSYPMRIMRPIYTTTLYLPNPISTAAVNLWSDRRKPYAFLVPSSIMRKFIYKSGRTQSAQGRKPALNYLVAEGRERVGGRRSRL